MTRIKAALAHFGISVFVFALFLSLVFFVWYAWPFNLTEGIAEIVYLMAGIDVVLGPLLTLIVFKAGKKSLKFDLSVIALVQVTALVYGGMIIYKERPGYVAFSEDRFYVVGLSEVDMSENTNPELTVGIFDKPKLIYIAEPVGLEAGEVMLEALNNAKEIYHLPKFYRDYAKNGAKVVAATSAVKDISVDIKPIKNMENMNYAPVVGRERNVTAILDAKTGEVVDYRLADPEGG